MLMRLVAATVVAVIVYLACILLGAILGSLGVPIATTVGGFLTQFAVVIGVLAGLWHFAGGTLHIGGAA
jgi:hypothetical protein